jgi:hypothetical protein
MVSVSDVVTVALIVGVSGVMTGVITPVVLSRLSSKQKREERAEDWARQDTVAERAAEATQAATAVATQAATTAEVVNAKLGQIHDLVNSSMTEALEGEATAVEGQLFMARKVARLEPTPADAQVISQLESRLGELRSKLADRARQTKIADAGVRDL